MKMYYAAVSPTGELIGIEESPESAVRLVKQKVDGPISVETLSDREEMVANPPPSAADMPELAERNVQIPRIAMDKVMAMTTKEAHEILLPFFAGIELRGEQVKKYKTPSGMTDAWIGQNYKTQKPTQDPRRPVEVMGLTLVPAYHARLAALARQDKDIPAGEEPPYKNPYENLFRPGEDDDDESEKKLARTKIKMLDRWKDPSVGLPSRIKSLNWCVGSSPECRSSCLIFAGQNASERYNTYRKVAQSHALLHQPVAFMRILLDAIDTWMADCTFYRRPHRGMELTPMFRLNVLSDIPWERIAPWFFSYYRGKSGENGKHFQAYDYTKVPGRRAGHRDGNRFVPFPDNYDLTFSLSGTDINEAYALEEIDRYTSRIAAVFLAYRNEGKWQTFTPKPKKAKEGVREEETMQQLIPLPKRFRFGPHDMAVRDGDLSDARPNDPHGVCVGLRWKIPSGKRSGAEDLKYDEVVINGHTVSMAKMSFVTPIYVKGTRPSRYEPNPDDDGAVLIAPVTPRQQSIDHTLSQGY